jgi:hypothetical protein
LTFILVESAILAFVHGSIAGLWVVTSLIAVEFGYLAGIYSRRVFERGGYFPQASERGV